MTSPHGLIRRSIPSTSSMGTKLIWPSPKFLFICREYPEKSNHAPMIARAIRIVNASARFFFFYCDSQHFQVNVRPTSRRS